MCMTQMQTVSRLYGGGPNVEYRRGSASVCRRFQQTCLVLAGERCGALAVNRLFVIEQRSASPMARRRGTLSQPCGEMIISFTSVLQAWDIKHESAA